MALRRGRTAERDAARRFLVPGLAHGRGGIGTTELDTLTPLMRRVEDGIAAAGDFATEPFPGTSRFGRRH